MVNNDLLKEIKNANNEIDENFKKAIDEYVIKYKKHISHEIKLIEFIKSLNFFLDSEDSNFRDLEFAKYKGFGDYIIYTGKASDYTSIPVSLNIINNKVTQYTTKTFNNFKDIIDNGTTSNYLTYKHQDEYFKIFLQFIHCKIIINILKDSTKSENFNLKEKFLVFNKDLMEDYINLNLKNKEEENYYKNKENLKKHNINFKYKKYKIQKQNKHVLYTHNILAYILILIILIIIILLKNIYIFLIFLIILNVLFEIKFNSIEKFNSNANRLYIINNLKQSFNNILIIFNSKNNEYFKRLEEINYDLYKEQKKYERISNKTETIINKKVHDINNNYIDFYNFKALISLLMRIIILIIILYILNLNLKINLIGVGVIIFMIILIIYLYSIKYLNRSDAKKKYWNHMMRYN